MINHELRYEGGAPPMEPTPESAQSRVVPCADSCVPSLHFVPVCWLRAAKGSRWGKVGYTFVRGEERTKPKVLTHPGDQGAPSKSTRSQT